MWNETTGLSMRRYPRAGLIGGVCAGIAAWFDWNAKIIRVLAVLGLIFGGIFPVAIVYLVLWYLMEADSGYPGSMAQVRGAAAGGDRSTATDIAARYARIEQRLRRMETCVSSREFELRREIDKLV